MINMDCMDYMRTLPDKAFQLAIVDPPYGLDRKSTQGAGKLKNRELNKADIARRWDTAPTEEYFKELVEFTKWARFERMGAFAYSEEDGTWSADHYEDDVPEEVKQARLDKLMRVQQHISAEIEADKIGNRNF